jgi:hypothetical protein
MKKPILSALIVVGLTVSLFVGVSESQDQTRVREEGRVEAVQKRTSELREAKSQFLRDKLLQLFQQRLQTMNYEEMSAKIADLQKELSEHKPKTKLQQAEKLLQEIVKAYPKIREAKQARTMLSPLNDLLFRVTEKRTNMKLVERSAKIVELKNNISSVTGFDSVVIRVSSVNNSPNQIRVHAETKGVTTLILTDSQKQIFLIEIATVSP